MRKDARTTADDESPPPSEPQPRERVVTVLAVGGVALAAVLAAATHAPRDVRADAPRAARGGTGVVQALPLASQADHVAPACAECGVVEAVVPLGPPVAAPGTAWQMRIRMDDGSVRTVEQRGALAAGSRVLVAGGSARLLPNRPGPG